MRQQVPYGWPPAGGEKEAGTKVLGLPSALGSHRGRRAQSLLSWLGPQGLPWQIQPHLGSRWPLSQAAVQPGVRAPLTSPLAVAIPRCQAHQL